MNGQGAQRGKNPADYFFPVACLYCGDRAEDSRLPFCSDCIKDFHISLVCECPECGNYRRDCGCEKGKSVVFLFYYYGSKEKQAILQLKNKPDKRIAEFFGRLLAEKVKQEKSAGFDCVTFVPRKIMSIRKYGGDQAEFIAKGTAKELGIPCIPLLARQKRRQRDQKLLDAVDRRKNVKNTFLPVPECENYRRVLLVDDITTTGATIEECAAILRKAGVKQVVGAVVAKTP